MKKHLRLPKVSLDGVDIELLRILHADARTPIAEIARALSMSAPSVSERLKRLRESGVIRSFTIEVDPALLGYELALYIRISPLPGQLSKVISTVAEIEEIVECDRITGDDCFIAKVHVRSTQEIEDVTDRLNVYAKTNTSLVQSSPVDRRLLPLVSDDS
ncbi:MAG: Lrp/AsnC family transcriptional regulator [Cyanobacteria bacterium P01_D01_bin.1]